MWLLMEMVMEWIHIRYYSPIVSLYFFCTICVWWMYKDSLNGVISYLIWFWLAPLLHAGTHTHTHTHTHTFNVSFTSKPFNFNQQQHPYIIFIYITWLDLWFRITNDKNEDNKVSYFFFIVQTHLPQNFLTL